MNNLWCLICIGFTMLISKSNASSDSDEEILLEQLIQLVMELNTRAENLESDLAALREQLAETSIIPPYTGVNFAICSGRPEGISGIAGVSMNEDLRCPPGSEERVGPLGQRDLGNELFSDFNVDYGIEGCEQLCIDFAGPPACVAFNWIVTGVGFNCELYGEDEPTGTFQPQAIIFCALRTVEEECELGEIITWSGVIEDLPEIYIPADGSTLNADDDYPDLCDLLIGTCGGLGCVVPDLEGRFPVGAGSTDSDEVNTDLCEEGGDTTLPLSVPTED